VTTVGTAAVTMLKQKPGQTLPELETALNSLVVGTLGVADGVGVNQDGEDRLLVEISRHHIELEDAWSNRCLGGPLASLVAAVAAYSHNRPIQVDSEARAGRNYRVVLRVLG